MSTIEQIGPVDGGKPVEANPRPIRRDYYAFSTLLCTPASLSQEMALAPGAQAGECTTRTSEVQRSFEGTTPNQRACERVSVA
jgi:hypothetical protein